MDYAKESLRLHKEWGGKIEVICKVPCKTKDDLSLAYTPGVAQPCLEIQKDISKSYELTRRHNLCAVITDGTAVLGLGDIGPEAGMPVMEGKCALFKAFADVDAWASAYVGYAYQNGIAQGAGPTAFRGGDAATPAQCVTFVLRALGYESGADFAWDSPWTLSDRIGLTLGRYGAEAGKTADRGGMVLLCRAALDCPMAYGSGTLRQHLQARGVLQEESDFIEFQ